MDDEERSRLIGNIVAQLKDTQERVRYRQAAIFYRVHPEYGTRVAEVVGLTSVRVAELAALDDEAPFEATAR